MAKTEFIEHKGKKILFMDFSKSQKKEILKAIEQTKNMAEKQIKPGTGLGLLDVTDSDFDPDIVKALKDLAAHNKQFMRMTAIIGVEGLKTAIYSVVMEFTGRKNLVLFDDIEKAKDWLAEL